LRKSKTVFHFNVRPAVRYKSSPDEKIGIAGFPLPSGLIYFSLYSKPNAAPFNRHSFFVDSFLTAHYFSNTYFLLCHL